MAGRDRDSVDDDVVTGGSEPDGVEGTFGSNAKNEDRNSDGFRDTREYAWGFPQPADGQGGMDVEDQDIDNDGRPDNADPDFASTNDGAVTGDVLGDFGSDGHGGLDVGDLDIDGDGIADNYDPDFASTDDGAAGAPTPTSATNDADGDGVVDGDLDIDGDGIADNFDPDFASTFESADPTALPAEFLFTVESADTTFASPDLSEEPAPELLDEPIL